MITLGYIKKEDAEYFITQRYKVLGLLYPFSALVFTGIYWFIMPKMQDLFLTYSQELPNSYIFAPYVVMFNLIFTFALAAYYFSKKVDKRQLQLKLKQYKAGEMIRFDKVIEMKETYLALTYIVATLVIIFAGILSPIYNLTSSFQ